MHEVAQVKGKKQKYRLNLTFSTAIFRIVYREILISPLQALETQIRAVSPGFGILFLIRV